jgi:hypothetical protein
MDRNKLSPAVADELPPTVADPIRDGVGVYLQWVQQDALRHRIFVSFGQTCSCDRGGTRSCQVAHDRRRTTPALSGWIFSTRSTWLQRPRMCGHATSRRQPYARARHHQLRQSHRGPNSGAGCCSRRHRLCGAGPIAFATSTAYIRNRRYARNRGPHGHCWEPTVGPGGGLRTGHLKDWECSTTILCSHSAHSVSSRRNADWRKREASCVSAGGLSTFSSSLSSLSRIITNADRHHRRSRRYRQDLLGDRDRGDLARQLRRFRAVRRSGPYRRPVACDQHRQCGTR